MPETLSGDGMFYFCTYRFSVLLGIGMAYESAASGSALLLIGRNTAIADTALMVRRDKTEGTMMDGSDSGTRLADSRRTVPGMRGTG